MSGAFFTFATLNKYGVPIILLAFSAMLEARAPQELNFEPLKFTPPSIERKMLASGSTLYILPDHDLPVLKITATLKCGTMFDPPHQTGLASLCGTLVRAGGTVSRKPDALDEELEGMGASVEIGVDTELTNISLFVLKKDWEKGVEILADVLRNPAFDRKRFTIEKLKIIESIRRRNDDPYQIARREFRKLVYGPDHPLSRTVEIREIKKISLKSLKQFYARYFRPNNLMISISGDFETDTIVKKLESAFREWKPSPIQFPEVLTVQKTVPSDLPRTVGLAEKSVNQSSIIVGHLGIKRHNPDRFALEVMNEILGGSSFTSRLYKDIRSRQGLAYWIGSSFSEPWDYGTIAAGCQTKNQTVVLTIRSILKAMEEIRNVRVSEEELKNAKDSIINSFVFRYASSHSIVAQKMSLDYFGFPQDYLDTYIEKIAAVTSEDVLKTAQKYLHPKNLTILVVGQKKDFDGSLDEFGNIRDLDIRIAQ
ncbi:MAG: insulinase family protein [Elusimicrobia bacterium]|nr:insulinase family protein [Elusimicrobiota bacterium]